MAGLDLLIYESLVIFRDRELFLLLLSLLVDMLVWDLQLLLAFETLPMLLFDRKLRLRDIFETELIDLFEPLFFLIEDLCSKPLTKPDSLRQKECYFFDFFELLDLIELRDFFDLAELFFEAIDLTEPEGFRVCNEFIERCVCKRSISVLLRFWRFKPFPYSILAFSSAFSLFNKLIYYIIWSKFFCR